MVFVEPKILLSEQPLAALEKTLSKKSPLILVEPEQAFNFTDDSDLNSLKKAVGHSLTYYRQLQPERSFSFGEEECQVEELTQTLEHFQKFLENNPTPTEVNSFIRNEFLIYRSNLPDHQSGTFSAYYEHTLKAQLTSTQEYRYPIYARPADLVDVDLGQFEPKKRGEKIVGRIEGKTFVPYYTREEIDSKRVLQGKGLELAWARDPLDILFLQVQGSGWIEVPGSTKTYHIRYAADNGRSFRSIGTVLIESGAISKKKFNRKKMVRYLKKQSEKERQFILNQNPRYIFFEIISSTNLTRGSLLVPLTAGRSIATDHKLYPKGALAWIKTEKPLFNKRGKFIGTKPLTRFVLNQDEGGAIKGVGRVDFFVGGGAEAEQTAQKFWFPGELYFFLKK